MIPLGLVLLTLLCGTTQASVLSTNLSPLNLAAFPVPILSVYSRYAKNGALYAGDEITFDASASTQPVSSTSYVFSFDFGDGGSVLSTSSAVTTHVYASGGYYRAVLRVADTAFASDSSQMYAVDADAYPASPTYVQVYVHERDTCYPYNITSNWTAGTDGTLGITVSLVNSASPASIAASTSLTSAFSSSGPPPLATIYNLTVSYSAFCSKYGSAWNMSVPYSLFNYYSPTIMTVSSNSTSVQGCAPRTTKFDISAQSNLTYFGYPMDTIKSDGTYSGLSIKSSNYQPAYLRLRTHGCMKKTGIAVLGSQSVGDSHGAHVIVSSSAFNTTLFRDLSQDPSGGVTPSQSMCTGITTCSNLQLQDVVILTSGALFATNRALTTTVFLSSVPDCVQAGGTYIFVAFAPTGSSIQGSLIYTNESNLNVGAWSSVITAAGISGLSSVYMFVGMTRYPPLLSNVYVLGISSSWCGSTVQACAGSAVVVVHNTTTSSISVLFTFPSTSTVVTGIHLHANGVDILHEGGFLL
ncbi:hypothetical protein BC830DRAFT_936870 [Chytriomyces sp. MP71]|nr:hypothetical protein BC830DRAFT_936870 [Chytriomyces sp. MP71]